MPELNSKEIAELHTNLKKQQESLQQTLDQARQSSETVELDQQAFGRVSRGNALQQQNMAIASFSQCQHRLRQVLKALARIDSEDYGFCLSCDNPIGFPRLKARPETPYCLDCQSKREEH